ncbi:MAG: 2,3-bisphosphoglycerate-independent phosphoglycerate mutase [Candidatus Puniceispirillum sp.]|nr:2,3-bisphosphoglycerate-independent phosphoglycerate mutase [Candidatus Pelagibacter sp.]MBA4282714.1 2,3-bisphosphoglycerate-independent phosphoglycerate mutase [Candidatus Puniceispirillum sp.]
MDQSVFLCILDGWGHREFDENNALTYAPYWRQLLEEYPHTFLNASEEFVGLPHGQMGNSEVGHMTIGLGRCIEQNLERINYCIQNDKINEIAALQNFIKKIKNTNNRCHIIGLFSDGGVHSHQDHFLFFSNYLLQNNIDVFLHPILDGRDTSQKAALQSIHLLDELCQQSSQCSYGTIGGRYFAMDRDKRWERTKKAYDSFLNILPQKKNFESFTSVILDAYQNNITDEFIEPSTIQHYQGIQENDSFLFINFRSDRMTQLLTMLTDKNFNECAIKPVTSCNIATMTNYSDEISSHVTVLFNKISTCNSLGSILSKNNISQFRIAETEKYAHVTYFFNGGIEKPFEGEERLLIPSPKVATYDLMPEMSAEQITNAIIDKIKSNNCKFILSNYANPDMVGHTGIKDSVITSVLKIDECLKRLVTNAIENNWVMIITADHGNVENLTEDNGQPHTAHTTNPVPFMVINYRHPIDFHALPKSLADIAPSVLQMMNISKPHEMSGTSVFQIK